MSLLPTCTGRPYKTALSHESAIEVMQDQADRGLWDPNIVHAFVDMVSHKQVAA